MTLFSELSGELQARTPMVLIHGFGGSAAAWDPVVAHLPENLPVIAYDLPGHRRSLHAEGRGGAGKMAKAILADLDQQGIKAFHLAGHSMGGAVAALIAMRAAGKARSLTMVAPGGMGPEINAQALERFSKAATADEISSVMRMMTALSSRCRRMSSRRLSRTVRVPARSRRSKKPSQRCLPRSPRR